MFNKKILCLGNNDQDTDFQTSQLAKKDNTFNHGLIDQQDFKIDRAGYYHTTVIDLPVGVIHHIADKFDYIILLDQPYNQWSSWKLLLISYNLIRDLSNNGHLVQYKDNLNVQSFIFFNQALQDNKSFCIHPWINFTEVDQGLKLCPRDNGPLLSMDRINNWKNDPDSLKIQQKMLSGQKMPERCNVCYKYEELGIESYRQYETQEWLCKLNMKSYDDLKNINQPYFYEIRLSNKCNIKCRSCNPLFSHLIEKEAKQYNIKYPVNNTLEYSTIRRIDIKTLTPESRVYLTGGEPTIINEVFEFMRECINQDRTDFEFTLGTNGVKFSPTFIKLCKHFNNLNFSFSLDGYGKINDYWRWGSDWETIVNNMHWAKNQGHRISINTVPGIYNVTNLHLLFEFLDNEFPQTGIYLQLNYFKTQSALNHPNSKLVLDSMKRCMQTNVYLADGKSTTTGINSLYNYYSKNPQCNLDHLKEFFDFNDQLDHARNSRLSDYIPELEACRHYIL